MKRSLIIFALMIILAAAAYAGGSHDAIQSYINSTHPAAKHIKMYESGEGVTMVLFTDHEMQYKIGFDQYNHPCCSEVEISSNELPLVVKENIPSDVTMEYTSYNATAKRHFYTVQYLQGTQKIKRRFDETGKELY